MGNSGQIHALSLVARDQHGNVTHDQLRADGFSRKQIHSRKQAGWLIQRYAEVYAVGHVPKTLESRIHAAVLSFGDAVASYESAGALWHLLRGAVRLEVTVPAGRGIRDRDGIVAHCQDIPPEHRRIRDGIPVTSLVRTVLDLAAIYRPGRLARVFEEAQVQHHLDPALLAAEVMCRPGHRGTARLRRVLRDAVDPAGVRSILELRFLRMCDRHGLPRPLVNEKVGPWMPDFLWPQQRVVVETDGWNFHRTAAKLRTAALKDGYLTGLGYIVVRLTWADVTERPDQTAALVRSALGTAVRRTSVAV